MSFDKNQFEGILKDFTIDSDELKTIAADFRYDLKKGLKDPAESSLKMLKSYIGLPTRQEKGEYLALDFGGTNVRVLLIRLEGDGKFEVLRKVAKPLVVPGSYNYIAADATAEQMFDFIAELVDEAIDGDHTKKYLLGHTFSFPSEQTNLYDAKGHKVGYSMPSLLGGENHYDNHGHKVGYSMPGLFGQENHYDSHGKKIGETWDNLLVRKTTRFKDKK